MSDKELWLWLATRIRSGSRKMKALYDAFGSISAIYNAAGGEYAKVASLRDEDAVRLSDKGLSKARKLMSECENKNIRIITPFDGEYPARLFETKNAPTVLFARGLALPAESVPAIGIVGTRRASSEGIDSAAKIAGEVVRGGGVVISGLARGIDTAVARAALENGGSTVAVLGCGVDICYPSENKRLMERIIYNGTVVSEYPPGMRPTRGSFPQRNRIISGLSTAVIIGEAPEKSGALITAEYAERQKRELFAVPAGFFSDNAKGSNALLAQKKAKPVYSGADIPGIREVHSAAPPHEDETPKLAGDEARIFAEIEKSPRTPDELIEALSLPAASVLADLTMLEIKGRIRRRPGNIFEIKRI